MAGNRQFVVPGSCLDWLVEYCEHKQVSPKRIAPLLDQHRAQPLTHIGWCDYVNLVDTLVSISGSEELIDCGRRSWQTAEAIDWLTLIGSNLTMTEAYEHAFSAGGFCTCYYPCQIDLTEKPDYQINMTVTFSDQSLEALCYFLQGQMQQLAKEMKSDPAKVRWSWHKESAYFQITLPAPTLLQKLNDALPVRKSMVSRRDAALNLFKRSQHQQRIAASHHQFIANLDLNASHKLIKQQDEAQPAWLTKLLQLTEQGLMLLAEDGNILWTSPGVEALMGYTSEDLQLMHITQLLPKTLANQSLHEMLNGKTPQGTVEATGVHHDRGVVPLRLRFSSLNFNDQTVKCCVISDTSDLRQLTFQQSELQSQLTVSQRLALIGQLSSEVAHDFNNLLIAITQHAEAALGGQEEDTESSLKQIILTSEMGTILTRQLLDMSQQRDEAMTVINVTALILGMEALIRRLLPESINISVSSSTGQTFVRGNQTQLEQVLLNLAVNARDAMPSGGHLGFTVSSEPGAVVITVTDTGAGMDEQIQSRIFDAFYSTKGQARGTGLGLAVVQASVLHHGGQIAVESEPGQGTCFKITLPALDPDQEAAGIS